MGILFWVLQLVFFPSSDCSMGESAQNQPRPLDTYFADTLCFLLPIIRGCRARVCGCPVQGCRQGAVSRQKRRGRRTTFCFLPLSRKRLRETWCSAKIVRPKSSSASFARWGAWNFLVERFWLFFESVCPFLLFCKSRS